MRLRGSCRSSATPSAKSSSALVRRYASTWISRANGLPAGRSYALRSVNVGLVTASLIPNPLASACANAVFPAPSSPESVTRNAPLVLGRTVFASSTASPSRPSSETIFSIVIRLYQVTANSIMRVMSAQLDADADRRLAAAREKEEEELAEMLSERYGFPYVDLTVIPVDAEALRVVPELEAREAEAASFSHAGKKLSLAVANPNNQALPGLLARLSERGFSVEQLLASHRSIEKAFTRYKEISLATETKRGVFDIESEKLATLSAELKDLAAVRALLEKTAARKESHETSLILEAVLAASLAIKASDIHLEPEERSVRLQLRLDGLLTDVFSFDEKLYHFVSSRIKILSGLKLNVKDRAQDGRFSVTLGKDEIEIRVSSTPGNYGESFVMRLLDPRSMYVSFENLGIHPKLAARLETEIKRPNGMLLTTGPTGSGKTTTLYAFLKKIHTPDIKIVTIEDPIEYHLQGIVQTQVAGTKYTFASGLRSIVRQDPDVIMVGEIRDGETAEIAIQAALTGHFVLSTLHTNNAAGTFPRLAELGIHPRQFASAATVRLAQRLVRTLNPETKTKRKTTDEEKKLIERVFSTLTDKTLYPASIDETWIPAPQKEDTGYRGREGGREAIFMDEKLGEFLRSNPSAGDIEKETRHQGYLTMAQDGVLKALAGET